MSYSDLTKTVPFMR